MSARLLTVPSVQGQNAGTFRQLAGASDSLNGVAGIGVLNPLGAKERRVQSRLSFANRSSSIYDGLGGAPAMEAGSKWPVRQPRSVRPHVIGVARGRVINLHLESAMSQDNSARASRANLPHNQVVNLAGEVVDTVFWVKEQAVIKRIRRKLAARNHSLLITREGTAARRELGEFAVLDSVGHPLQTHADLAALGRFLGVLADAEMIEPPPEKGWRYFVARYRIVQVDGVNARYAEPISREYTTRSAANKAAQGISERDDLALVAYDANRRDGAL